MAQKHYKGLFKKALLQFVTVSYSPKTGQGV
jgi:hypothetical protein